ncbi:MAG: hypothetical protein SF162_11820 [bacterium]|nr:hypothetical protein [bacterium]
MSRFACVLLLLAGLVLSAESVYAQEIPLTERLNSPDGRYGVGYPAGWAAQIGTPNSFTDFTAALVGDGIRIDVGIVAPAQLSNPAAYLLRDFRSVAAQLLADDEGAASVAFNETRIDAFAALGGAAPDGRRFAIAIDYGSHIGAVIVTAEGASPGELPRDLAGLARAVAGSIRILGVAEPEAVSTPAPFDPNTRTFALTDAPITFRYPADWYVLIPPAREFGAFDTLIDLYNGRAALGNQPNADGGLTAFEPGEFALRVIVLSAADDATVVDVLTDEVRILPPDVYQVGTLETLVIGSAVRPRDAARIPVNTAVRDGEFLVIALAPGRMALLSSSAAPGEGDIYRAPVMQIAESLVLTDSS